MLRILSHGDKIETSASTPGIEEDGVGEGKIFRYRGEYSQCIVFAPVGSNVGAYGENPKGAEAVLSQMEEKIVGPVVAEPPFLHSDIDQEVVQKGWGVDSVEPAKDEGVVDCLSRQLFRFGWIDDIGEPTELGSEEFRRGWKGGGDGNVPASRQKQRE